MHGEIKQYWHLLWVFSAAARKFSFGTRRVPKWCIFVHLVRSYRAAMFVLHCNTFKSHPMFAPGSRAAKNKLWTSVLASNIFEVTVLKENVWKKVCRHESLVWLVYGKYKSTENRQQAHLWGAFRSSRCGECFFILSRHIPTDGVRYIQGQASGRHPERICSTSIQKIERIQKIQKIQKIEKINLSLPSWFCRGYFSS